ncbi:hypothetical protein HPB52_023499 [Rhipicephalus sanguineus]|uniref:Uncharacterized protein n=1 Tax=Rhipicephalus sanguineus TaxID=34632 RepID=A0A9D4TC36_RHISA|nr:hypothetical protein HPB52_023499 [Rhipicephalus sanguineus]
MVVCSEHFNKDDFFWGHLGNKGQDTAVPPEAVTDGDCACELPNYPEEGEYDGTPSHRGQPRTLDERINPSIGELSALRRRPGEMGSAGWSSGVGAHRHQNTGLSTPVI